MGGGFGSVVAAELGAGLVGAGTDAMTGGGVGVSTGAGCSATLGPTAGSTCAALLAPHPMATVTGMQVHARATKVQAPGGGGQPDEWMLVRRWGRALPSSSIKMRGAPRSSSAQSLASCAGRGR